MSWPIPEFAHQASEEVPLNWNDPLYLDEAIEAVEWLRLEAPEVVAADQWRDLVEQVWAYVDSIVLPGLDLSVLISELR